MLFWCNILFKIIIHILGSKCMTQSKIILQKKNTSVLENTCEHSPIISERTLRGNIPHFVLTAAAGDHCQVLARSTPFLLILRHCAL
jgi:hypothetical protein